MSTTSVFWLFGAGSEGLDFGLDLGSVASATATFFYLLYFSKSIYSSLLSFSPFDWLSLFDESESKEESEEEPDDESEELWLLLLLSLFGYSDFGYSD